MKSFYPLDSKRNSQKKGGKRNKRQIVSLVKSLIPRRPVSYQIADNLVLSAAPPTPQSFTVPNRWARLWETPSVNTPPSTEGRIHSAKVNFNVYPTLTTTASQWISFFIFSARPAALNRTTATSVIGGLPFVLGYDYEYGVSTTSGGGYSQPLLNPRLYKVHHVTRKFVGMITQPGGATQSTDHGGTIIGEWNMKGKNLVYKDISLTFEAMTEVNLPPHLRYYYVCFSSGTNMSCAVNTMLEGEFAL